jgi:hypothetical protein
MMRIYRKKGRPLPCHPQTGHLFTPQTALDMGSSIPGNCINASPQSRCCKRNADSGCSFIVCGLPHMVLLVIKEERWEEVKRGISWSRKKGRIKQGGMKNVALFL